MLENGAETLIVITDLHGRAALLRHEGGTAQQQGQPSAYATRANSSPQRAYISARFVRHTDAL